MANPDSEIAPSAPAKSTFGTIRLALLIVAFLATTGVFGKLIYDRNVVGAYGNDSAALAFMDKADPRALSADDLTSFRYDAEA
ncbi:MAG: hypothetical protein AAF334_07305, partial [Pseudomonadota bacterium]